MVGFVVIGPIRDLGSKQPWTLSHKYMKNSIPLGKVPHSSIGGFSLYLIPALSFFFCSCIFKLRVWLQGRWVAPDLAPLVNLV